jgi:hypothetical protein
MTDFDPTPKVLTSSWDQISMVYANPERLQTSLSQYEFKQPCTFVTPWHREHVQKSREESSIVYTCI